MEPLIKDFLRRMFPDKRTPEEHAEESVARIMKEIDQEDLLNEAIEDLETKIAYRKGDITSCAKQIAFHEAVLKVASLGKLLSALPIEWTLDHCEKDCWLIETNIEDHSEQYKYKRFMATTLDEVIAQWQEYLKGTT